MEEFVMGEAYWTALLSDADVLQPESDEDLLASIFVSEEVEAIY